MYNLVQATESDYNFVYEVNKENMKDMVVKIWWIWDEDFQHKSLKNQFIPKEYKIIVVNWVKAWIFKVTDEGWIININIIQLKWEFQWKWIWSDLIKKEIKRAKKDGKDIKLQVFKINNKARFFYERLWFEIIEENETHFIMKFKN